MSPPTGHLRPGIIFFELKAQVQGLRLAFALGRSAVNASSPIDRPSGCHRPAKMKSANHTRNPAHHTEPLLGQT